MSRDKVILGAVSLIMALLLWLQVDTQRAPAKQRELAVRVETRNVPADMIVTRGPRTVKVIAEGTTEQLDRITAEQIAAFVDFQNAGSGLQRYLVQLSTPRINVPLRLQRAYEQFELSRMESRAFKLSVEPRGIVAGDLRYEGASADPETVSISAPEQALAKVNFVRAMLDLSKIRPGETMTAKVEVLDKDGRPIPFASSDPEEVTLRPAVAAAPATNRFLITPQWQGQPAFGYEVTAFTVRPNQVEAAGSPAVLARVQRIETEPIDLSGLRETTTFTVKLKRVDGIRLTGETSVRVTVVVGATASSAPPSPLPEGPGP